MTTEPALAEQLGRYQLSRKLASGGIAEVFLARAEGPAGFEKSLVIKRIHPALVQNEEFVGLFLREARNAAQLDHPNCVQIFDFGEVGGTWYLAMEFIDGVTLRQVVDAAPGRKLPLALAARIVTFVCEGLAFAHELGNRQTGESLGLVHGNVSPEHVMIARNGGVKVIDFGVSRVANLVAGTAAGTVKGRICYQPVEQLLDEPDHRADVYALGVMLYELGAGATPYPPLPEQQLFDAVMSSEPVPLSQLVPGIDPTYAAIVERAMARDAEHRYADCRELEADLADFVRASGERIGTQQLAQLVAGGVAAVVSTPRPSAPRGGGFEDADIHIDDFDAPSEPAPPPEPELPAVVEGQAYASSASSIVQGTEFSSSSIVPGTPVSSTSSLTMDLTEPASPPAGGLFGGIAQVAVAPRTMPAPAPGGLFSGIAQVAVAPRTMPAPPPGGLFSGIAQVSVAPVQGAAAGPSFDGFFAPPAPSALPAVGGQFAPPAPHGASAAPYEGFFQAPAAVSPPAAPAVAPAPRAPSYDGFFQSAPAAPSASSPVGARPLPSAPPASTAPSFSGFFQPPPSSAPPPPAPPPAPPSAPPGYAGFFAPPPSAPTPSAPAGAGFFDSVPAPPAAPVPSAAPAAPRRAAGPSAGGMDAETRAQAVLASAKSMRMFEAGPVLGTPQELDVIRVEVERDEGALLLVRFALNAARLHQANPEQGVALAERLVGVVEGLLLAEAYTPLAGLLERLEAGARDDADVRWVHETMRAAFATPDQAARLGARLRELAPSDGPGLGRVIAQFGGEYAPLWISAYEAMELPGSREAMQPGLAGLASKNPAPFLQRLDTKRPRRVSEFVYFLEKGRGAERHRLFKELMSRPEPLRRREVLAGLAQAGSDDGLRFVTQALADADEESRTHAVQLLAKHYPDKAFTLVQPLLDDSYDARSLAERQALWRALGAAGTADVLAGMAEVLKRKPTLLNRSKLEARKLDVLEGLAEMKRPEVPELFEAVLADRSQPDPVRAAAQRLLAALRSLQRTVEPVEARRWERTPSTWRDVLLDLAALSDAARLLEVTSPLLDVAFTRLRVRIETLLRGAPSPAVFAVSPGTVSVNGEHLSSSENDGTMRRIIEAFARRGVTGFTITAPVAVDELQQLVRWLALGPAARAVHTPRVQRTWASGFEPLPALPAVAAPSSSEPSKEAMTRFATLVLELRGFASQRKGAPTELPPELRTVLHELALTMHSRSVRFLGLAPAAAGLDALVFHTTNVLMLSLGFAAELGLSKERLAWLAEAALYSDAGQFELPAETLQRGAPPSKEDLLRVRRASLRLPFARQGDAPAAVRWACIVVDQEKGTGAEHSLLGDLVALARAWEGLTSTQTPEAALEALTTRLASRFRPELLALFVRYAKRQSWRPLQPKR